MYNLIVEDLKEALENIEDKIAEANDYIERIDKQNQELKSTLYKDNEIIKLKEENKELEKKCNHFGLSNFYWDLYKSYEKKHNQTCGYTPYLKIDDTPIVTIYSVKCDKCGFDKSIYI